MAVLDSLPGIEITICVDEEPLKEYENIENEAMLVEPEALDEKFEVAKHQRSVTVKKFVESEAGKFFSINCAVKDPYRYTGFCTHIAFKCLVDGEILTEGNAMSKDEYEENGFSYNDAITVNTYREQGQELLQRFQFVKTRIIQDNPIIEATEPYKRACFMGEIEIQVFRCLFKGYSERPNNRPLTTRTEVPESMLKEEAKSHSTLFGEGEVIKPQTYARAAFCGGGENYPIAIFKFQYGSKELLKKSPEPKNEPDFCFGPDPESVLKPISELQAPKMPLLDIKVERGLLQKTFHAGSTSSTPVDTFVCSPIKQELQEADGRNPTPAAPTQPVIFPNHVSPLNPANLNIQALNPTQTGQLIGQIGQLLQLLQGQVGQSAQVPAHTPAPFPVDNADAATPTPPVSASRSRLVNVTASDPPIKREQEQNEIRNVKRRRKPRGKVTIDLTEDDSDDNIVINLDSD